MARADMSSTQLSLLRECPRAYRERYVEGRKGGASASMRRGSLVHLCLERAAKERVGNGNDVAFRAETIGPAPVEELLGYLDEYTARASYPAVSIQEARAVLDACAPLDLSHVRHVEEEWRISARDGRTFTTKIDRADYHDTYFDREGALGMIGPTVLVHDYKTGEVVPRAELRDHPQTLSYLCAVKERYPDEHVGIVYDYISRGISHAPIWWSPDLDRQARGMIEEALAELDRRRNGLDAWGEIAADPWPGRAGAHCKWCHYKAGCDEYANYLRSGEAREGDDPISARVRTDPALLSIDDLLAEYVRSRDATNLNEDRRKACGNELRARIGDAKELAGAEFKARVVVVPDYLLDAHAAAQAVVQTLVEQNMIAPDGNEEEEIVARIAPREVSSRKLNDYLDTLPAAVRKAAKKKIEESKVPVDAGSHVRVEDFKNPFAVGQEEIA